MAVDDTQDQSPSFAGLSGTCIALLQCCGHSAAPLPAAADSAIRHDLSTCYKRPGHPTKATSVNGVVVVVLRVESEGRRHQWVSHFDGQQDVVDRKAPFDPDRPDYNLPCFRSLKAQERSCKISQEG
jgi:hypothetical protein